MSVRTPFPRNELPIQNVCRLPSSRLLAGPRVGRWAAIALASVTPWLAAAPKAGAQAPFSLTDLHEFGAVDGNQANGDGDGPSNFILGGDGNFYGTTLYGGSAGVGTIYQLTPSGQLTQLHSFSGGQDQGYPFGPLYLTSDNTLYGTTTGTGNGYGTIFELTFSSSLDLVEFSTLYTFTGGTDGAYPYAGLTPGNDGYLYGTTNGGGEGSDGGNGVIFRLNPSSGSSFQSLYNFTGGSDGFSPQASLLLASDGNFYGTTLGGANGYGTIFQFNPTTSVLTPLYAFTTGNSSVGAGVSYPLIEGPNSTLYGVASRGGDSNNDGFLFSITTAGAFNVLYSFTGGNDGSQPIASLMLGKDGNLYGSAEHGGANGDGTLFELPLAGGTPTVLYTFSAESNGVNPDGYNPTVPLIQVGNVFYGGTFRGGTGGSGAIFELAQNPAFFAGQASLGSGVYYLSFSSGNYFGYYSYLSDPNYIYHFDLGFEYVFDANDGKDGVYFYDFASSDFFYTSPSFPFPYLFDFGLNTVLYYYPNPNEAGHYNTNGYRFFYDFATQSIITK